MPRLPTMRVIGSQDISTSWRCGAVTVAMKSLLTSMLTNPRQLFPGEQRDHALPAHTRAQNHHSRMVVHYLSDKCGALPQGVRPHRAQHMLGVLRRHDGD